MIKLECNNCGILLNNQKSVRLTLENEEEVHLCFDCHNNQMSSKLGIKDEALRLKTFTLKDADNNLRTFDIEKIVTQMGISFEAAEGSIADYGYKFAVLGEVDDDQKMLVRHLTQKIQDGLIKKYMKTEYLHGKEMLYINENVVVGRIEADLDSINDRPLIIVDGKSYTWEEFGKLLLQFEGFQFKLETFDLLDDVE